MSTPRKVAVLDIGKTNAKVVVVDCMTGAEVAERRTPNLVLSGPPYPRYDIEALWTFALGALATFAENPGFDAISITTHGASAVVLDAAGNLALPAVDYEHQYPDDIQEAYASLRPAFSETFSPALPGGLNVGAQLHYQKSRFPKQFAHVRTIMTYPQYWAFRLTGIAANEVTSLGCHTDLWRPREGTYSSLVDTLGIRTLMPPLRSAFDALGPVLPGVAQKIGLTRSTPVYCGIHDSNASLLPHLIGREPPFTVISTGTWVVNFAVGGDLDHLDPKRDALANVDAYGRAVPSSRFMGGREFELLAAELGDLDPEAALAAIPQAIEKRIMLLPNLAAGSGPFPGRQRQWINDGGAATAERWAAACLYLALMTETCLGLIGAKGPVLVEGPFSSNPAYLKALQSLLGRNVLAIGGTTGTSHGAALAAGAPLIAHESVRQPWGTIEGIANYRADWHRRITASPI
ncbi:FGGY-family carbohydrate kinase [Rhizobium terrae]|uniref:FGGY-family carbohydrate kinase n=1 Tax=Rhizobium terrae TaxID=2171756 RepID=UPI000E3BBEBD|nr:FGGY-family carbohydrate kinase [Rhizobium terrae]